MGRKGALFRMGDPSWDPLSKTLPLSLRSPATLYCMGGTFQQVVSRWNHDIGSVSGGPSAWSSAHKPRTLLGRTCPGHWDLPCFSVCSHYPWRTTKSCVISIRVFSGNHHKYYYYLWEMKNLRHRDTMNSPGGRTLEEISWISVWGMSCGSVLFQENTPWRLCCLNLI